MTIEEMMFEQSAAAAEGQAPGAISAPAEDVLARLAVLGSEQLKLEQHIARGEALLKQLNAELHQLRTKTIPEAMTAAGVAKFGMLDGSEVVIEKQYFASIPSEDAIEKAQSNLERQELLDRRRAALTALRDSGNGDIIKNQFRQQFGRGEDALAAQLAAILRKRGIEFTQTEGVHPSTLKAFVKEQLEKGRLTTDMQTALGAFVLDVAKIKAKKEKKEKKSR